MSRLGSLSLFAELRNKVTGTDVFELQQIEIKLNEIDVCIECCSDGSAKQAEMMRLMVDVLSEVEVTIENRSEEPGAREQSSVWEAEKMARLYKHGEESVESTDKCSRAAAGALPCKLQTSSSSSQVTTLGLEWRPGHHFRRPL